MPLCRLVSGYQHFGENWCIHLQDRNTLNMEAATSVELLVTAYKPIRYGKSEDEILNIFIVSHHRHICNHHCVTILSEEL